MLGMKKIHAPGHRWVPCARGRGSRGLQEVPFPEKCEVTFFNNMVLLLDYFFVRNDNP